MMGLVGGGLMAFAVLGLDASNYIDKLRDAVDLQHFMAGMIKAPFAAVIIGLVGCLEGLKRRGQRRVARHARDQPPWSRRSSW